MLYEAGNFPTIDLDKLRAYSTAGAEYVRDLVGGKRYRDLPRS